MPHRTFKDAIGRTWEVWQVCPSRVERRGRVPAPAVPPAVERRRRHEYRAVLPADLVYGWLVFETLGEKRRLSNFPPDWHAVSEEKLAALCQVATPAPPSRRLVE